MKNPVLLTRPVYEQHTSTHLAEKLQEAVAEYKLEKPKTIAVTTDNARNIVNAVSEAGLGPQIGCFAHTYNQVSRLLGKIRRAVSFFHHSTTAAHILEQKQEMLHLPKHRLINDVATRWNSSYEMVERYLEQQSPVYSALSALKNKDIANLTVQEVRVAENLIEIMKPLKTVTTILNTETAPSVSMILPLKTMILKSMEQNDEDTPTVREVKHAIRENLQKRYSDAGLQDFLHKCTALDPRFKTLPHLDRACHLRINEDLIVPEVLSRAETVCINLILWVRPQRLQASPATTSQATSLPATAESAPPPFQRGQPWKNFLAHFLNLAKVTSLI
ncbi:Zinc finger BED domain containing protein 1 [Dissostichus eleginoides]|uniref:Zinc finger BED domain containing protein 1 n=1 Tax=Dissostichus eleginoides TaxID=100907 RepID=A0AAD9CMR6_DISEL|nr:Zinc finger BED domain containing protein 1 [Dissostichus eleginoides]